MYVIFALLNLSPTARILTLTTLKAIQNNDIAGLDTVLGREDATLDQIIKTAEEFYRVLYGQKKAASLNDARCRVYKSRKKPPALKNLPPTDQNVLLHTLRAHLQMLLWKAAGWEITQDGAVMPTISDQQVSPAQLLDIVSRGCSAVKAGNQMNYSCRVAGLSCTD